MSDIVTVNDPNPSITIRYAALHAGVFVVDIGTIGPTLELGSPTSKIIELELSERFLKAVVKGPKGNTAKLLIPLTNVTHMVPK